MGVLAPFHHRWKYAIIGWSDNGVARTIVLRFGKSEFVSFQSELASRTGLKFEDLSGQRDALAQEIERRQGEALPLLLDRKVLFKDGFLKKGSYRILAIETGPGTGNLYVFGSKIELRKALAAAPVVIAPADSVLPTGATEPVYTQRAGWTSLDAIRMPAQTIRISARND